MHLSFIVTDTACGRGSHPMSPVLQACEVDELDVNVTVIVLVPTSNFQLPTSNFQLPYFEVPAGHCGFIAMVHGPWAITYWPLSTGQWPTSTPKTARQKAQPNFWGGGGTVQKTTTLQNIIQYCPLALGRWALILELVGH